MRINNALKVLADPTRQKIVRLLRQNGELTAGEVADHFTTTKPTISHHFSVLKEADLISARRDGQQIYYSLNTTAVEDLLALVLALFSPQRGNGEPNP